jgi:hypothetical protein
MRGFLQPSLRVIQTETQTRFATFSRGRRVKLAQAAQTTLLKADQWARGDGATAEISAALDKGVLSVKPRKV